MTMMSPSPAALRLFGNVALLVALAVAQVPAQDDVGIFTEVPAPAGAQAIGPLALRERWVTIDVDSIRGALPQELGGTSTTKSLDLNLFPGTRMVAVLGKAEATSRGYVWDGTIEGVPGTATISVADGVIAANVSVDGAVYEIRHVSNGVHVIRQVDTSAFPSPSSPLPPAIDAAEDRPLVAPTDDGSIIDVLVLWTTSVENALGSSAGAFALAQLAVADANAAFASSGVGLRLRAAGDPASIYWPESGDINEDLHRLQRRSDGIVDEVHARRDALRADIVHVIGDWGVECGLGFRMPTNSTSFASSAFSVSGYGCTATYSMAHEIGHNMGLHHDAYVRPPGETGVFAYSNGYVNQSAFAAGAPASRRWRDIMAYPDQCQHRGFNCPRLRYFSSPHNSVDGEPMGTAAGADAARSLNETRVTVSNFRSIGAPGSFNKSAPANGATDVPTSVTPGWSDSSWAYRYYYCIDTINDNDCNTSWTRIPTSPRPALSLQPSTTYYWQVRAENEDWNANVYANGGTWWTFTTFPTPRIRVDDVSLLEGQSGLRNASFTVSLTAASPSPVTVGYATANGTATAGASSTFSNTSAISFPTSGNGSPYPSSLVVGGQFGAIARLTVTLAGFTHLSPADVDVLLVGPMGHTVVLMSDAGASSSNTDLTLTFDDSGPSIGRVALTSGTFRPTNVADDVPSTHPCSPTFCESGNDDFSAPAPPGPYGSTLAAFNGTAAAGTWLLYVRDDYSHGVTVSAPGTPGPVHQIGSWSLTMTTTGGGDYVGAAGTLTFPAGSMSQTVAIAVTGDTAAEAAETFTLELSNPAGAPLSDSKGIGVILNDDLTDPAVGGGAIRAAQIAELRADQRVEGGQGADGIWLYRSGPDRGIDAHQGNPRRRDSYGAGPCVRGRRSASPDLHRPDTHRRTRQGGSFS
jgi:hypothetical protein